MKGIFNKFKGFISEWYYVLILVILGAGMIWGLNIQSATYESQLQNIEKTYQFQVDFYKQETDNIKTSGDILYKAYFQEKANSELKDSILEKQQKIIQELLKQLQEYKKWQNVDPDFIT
jgi:hypothetical protein